ncbi:MAG: amidohydrolase [Paracoccaceae bacterium]|nr:MAG: amidohydrolase [Paracoccaceae bacterium]
MDFATLPRDGRFSLANLRMPGCLLGASGDLERVSITIEAGRIAEGPAAQTIDMGGRIAMPAFVDMHTHLDKGHIWPRAANPDGSFAGALEAVTRDRAARWRAEDVRRRMDFALRCAWAHGTRAIRTHIDSIPPQDEISWPVFREMREEWRGRIALQACCLVPIDQVAEDGPFARTADLVARSGGVLGAVAYPVPDLDRRLDVFFRMAARRGLAADFHVDETGDPGAAGLRAIAQAVLRTGFDAPVVAGHCCSLAVQPAGEAERTLDLVAEAGIAVVSLPMCNMYLQDRRAGRTPRWRGVTLVHEMAARGIPVAFASDNTRDPFYAYGDLDMVEVMREATRIAHLDHSAEDWPASFSRVPADICGFDACQGPGGPADLVIFNARSWTELFARPQADRVVLRAGRQIDRRLPDYSELDDLMEAP